MSIKQHSEIHFPGQRPNEHVVLFLRRHWTVFALDTIQLILTLCVPPLLLAFGFLFTSFEIEQNSIEFVLLVQGISIYYILTFVIFFHDFVDYHLDVWIVTDQRIISIEQNGLFDRIISELNLTKLQDVTSEVQGKVQTLFDFGQVFIQTAGETGRFTFEQVPHPSEIAKVVLQLHDRAIKMQHLEQVHESVAYEQQLEQQQPQKMHQYGPQQQAHPQPQAQPQTPQPPYQPYS